MQFTPALLLDLIAWNWPGAKKLAWWARQLVKDPWAETVARHVHNEVLRILRPAESMVRRRGIKRRVGHRLGHGLKLFSSRCEPFSRAYVQWVMRTPAHCTEIHTCLLNPAF